MFLDQNMEIDFSKITVAELLEKIGAGKPTPGSGSTAAFQLFLNVELLLTVIKVTLKPKQKEEYGHEWGQMTKLKEKIETDYIYTKARSTFSGRS